VMSGSSEIAYLVEGGGRDLSVPFPLVKLCRHDVVPEEVEDLVGVDGLRESWTRAENHLKDVRSSIPIPVMWSLISGGSVQEV